VTPRAWSGLRLLAGSIAAATALVLGAGTTEAQPVTRSDTVTIGMLAATAQKSGYDALIRNFERVRPDIHIAVTYTLLATDLTALEATQLAAGNAPELLTTFPGCSTPISVCTLAKAGYLAPMVRKPWVKWSLPLVTSLSKVGQTLFAFEPTVSPFGIFTNDDLFNELGLRIPRTFPQLLDVCRKAKAAGTPAVLLAGSNMTRVSFLLADMAVATVYGKDTRWPGKQRAGQVTFEGTPGWHQALQQFVDMNDAGCFQPGAAGTASVLGQFAEGEGLMVPYMTTDKGQIDANNPQFRYSHHPFPGGAGSSETTTLVNLSGALAVNAHASARGQAAAQAFVDFIARPKQNALFAQLVGGLTQYQFLHGQIPDFMSDFGAVFEAHEYVMSPISNWWNPAVLSSLQQDAIGLITGQRGIDDVLNAMDAAWNQGPS
jgi:raffinose/stachyose/melibiose transport system substrate-binding protein